MKLLILLCMALPLSHMPVAAQQPSQRNDKELGQKDVAISGCLTRNPHNEYELVDKEGSDNLPYSTTVDLEKYLGHRVTFVGRRASTPSAETTPGPVQTHFLVKKVRSASGQCNQ